MKQKSGFLSKTHKFLTFIIFWELNKKSNETKKKLIYEFKSPYTKIGEMVYSNNRL